MYQLIILISLLKVLYPADILASIMTQILLNMIFLLIKSCPSIFILHWTQNSLSLNLPCLYKIASSLSILSIHWRFSLLASYGCPLNFIIVHYLWRSRNFKWVLLNLLFALIAIKPH